MKIALVSTGLGKILRGFESFTESLYLALKEHAPSLDVALFQGGGTRKEGRFIVPNFHRNDRPASWFSKDKGNLLEKRTFALALYSFLRSGGFDLIHYNELAMGSALFHLRRIFGGKFKLLYCDGAPSPPAHYHHRCDYAQILTGPAYLEACSFGISNDRLFQIPYGINENIFSKNIIQRRDETRKKIGIPLEANVVLTVAALEKKHKRLNYLIREISGLNSSIWLLAAGQRTQDTPELERSAEEALAGRYRFISWPRERVPLLYGAADFFVLPSIMEGFGLVIVEALLSDLPTVIHNGPVFEWVSKGTSAIRIDMKADGQLKKTLEGLMGKENKTNSREVAANRFGWKALIPHYLKMYERVGRN